MRATSSALALVLLALGCRSGAVSKEEAVVVLKPGYAPSADLADELARRVKSHLGAFQRPREIEWVPELPMTVSGKVKRSELRKRPPPAHEVG